MQHKDVNSITKVSIHQTPEEKQKHGRPKTTWQRTVEAEMKNMIHTWGTIPRLAVTDRGEGASLLPYMPAGMMGSDEDDDDDELDKTCLERAGAFDNQLSSLFQSYFPHPNQSLFSLLTNCDQGSVLVECRLVIERLLV